MAKRDPLPPETYEEHYLAAASVYGGSGHSGDAASWEAVRRPLVQAIDHDGTFLDIGCANGLLMESVVEWSRWRVEPYGLDHSEKLAALARRRLPRWQDRIFVGDALTWEPPHRFDFVRTELAYVAKDHHRRLVDRLLDRVVERDGRLLVCGYGGDPVCEPLRGWGYEPALELGWVSPNSGLRCELAVLGLRPAP